MCSGMTGKFIDWLLYGCIPFWGIAEKFQYDDLIVSPKCGTHPSFMFGMTEVTMYNVFKVNIG
jgi:hypothetical protein